MSDIVEPERFTAVASLYSDLRESPAVPFLRRNFAHLWNPPQSLDSAWKFPSAQKLWNLYNEPCFLGFKPSARKRKQPQDAHDILDQLDRSVKRVKVPGANEDSSSFLAHCPIDCEPEWSKPDPQLLRSHNISLFGFESTMQAPRRPKSVAVEYIFNLNGEQRNVMSPKLQCLLCGLERFEKWEILLFHLKTRHALLSYQTTRPIRQDDRVCVQIFVSDAGPESPDTDSREVNFALPSARNRYRQTIQKLSSLTTKKLVNAEDRPQINGVRKSPGGKLQHEDSRRRNGIEDFDRQIPAYDFSAAKFANSDMSSLSLTVSESSEPNEARNLRPARQLYQRAMPSLTRHVSNHRSTVQSASNLPPPQDDDSAHDSARSSSHDYFPNGAQNPLLVCNQRLDTNGDQMHTVSDSRENNTPNGYHQLDLDLPPSKRRKISFAANSTGSELMSGENVNVLQSRHKIVSKFSGISQSLIPRSQQSTKSPKESSTATLPRQSDAPFSTSIVEENSNLIATTLLADISHSSLMESNLLSTRKMGSAVSERPRMKYRVPPAPGEGRHFFRIVSKRVIEEGELLSESDDGADQNWLEQRHVEKIRRSRRWTTLQKKFLVKWDVHFIREHLQGRRYVADSITRFMKANLQWLQREDMKKELFAKLKSLEEDGTISEDALANCMKLIDDQTGQNTLPSNNGSRQNNFSTPTTPRDRASNTPANSGRSNGHRRIWSSDVNVRSNAPSFFSTPDTGQSNRTAGISKGSSRFNTPLGRKEKAAGILSDDRDKMTNAHSIVAGIAAQS